jgi:hypothetical protein
MIGSLKRPRSKRFPLPSADASIEVSDNPLTRSPPQPVFPRTRSNVFNKPGTVVAAKTPIYVASSNRGDPRKRLPSAASDLQHAPRSLLRRAMSLHSLIKTVLYRSASH